MTALSKFWLRELRRAWLGVALITLVLVVQATALAGGYLAEASLFATRDSWSNALHLADLDVRFAAAAEVELPPLDELRAIDGVAAVTRRYVGLGTIERNGGTLPVVLEYLEGHPSVDDVAVLRGRWIGGNTAVVDRSFPDVAIGDELVVNPHRLASRFVVGGVGLSAEYLIPTANPDLVVPKKGSLGVIYVSREALDRTFPDRLYNDVVVSFVPGKDPTNAVLRAMSNLAIERVVRKSETFGWRFVALTLSGTRSVTPVSSLLIALMAAIVAFVSMHRFVAERQRSIGCLLALGHTPRAIGMYVLAIALVPGVLAALVGIPTAMLFARYLAGRLASIAGLPEPVLVWPPKWFLLGSGSALVVAFVSALPHLRDRDLPIRKLRGGGEIRFAGAPRWLESLLVGRTALRYAVRNLFRRRRLSAATAFLVALAVALPAGFTTTLGSWEAWSKREHPAWDAVATFTVPLAESEVEDLVAEKGIATYEGYVQGYATVDGAEMRVRGLESDAFSNDDADEAIVNTAYSDGHAPAVGSFLTIDRNGPRRLRVVARITEASFGSILVPRRTAQRIFGLGGKLSGAYLRYGASRPRRHAAPSPERGSADEVEAIDVESPAARTVIAEAIDPRAALLREELVSTVDAQADVASATMTFIGNLNALVGPFIALSGLLSFLFLLSVLGFLLLERETEYATLRSLGYGTADIAQMVLGEIVLLGLAGLLLSLGAWFLVVHALRAPMDRTWFPIPDAFRAHDFAACALPMLAFLGLATLPGIRRLVKMNLAAALRGRSIG